MFPSYSLLTPKTALPLLQKLPGLLLSQKDHLKLFANLCLPTAPSGLSLGQSTLAEGLWLPEFTLCTSANLYMHTHNLQPSFTSQGKISLTAQALTQGQNALDGSSPHHVLSHGVPWRPATASHHVNGSSPELLQWKANLESWDTQPSSQERLPNGGLPVLFVKNRLDKKATKLAEPEINKPAFGQGQAFKTGYILCFLSSS